MNPPPTALSSIIISMSFNKNKEKKNTMSRDNSDGPEGGERGEMQSGVICGHVPDYSRALIQSRQG